jgi:hypothetical protein
MLTRIAAILALGPCFFPGHALAAGRPQHLDTAGSEGNFLVAQGDELAPFFIGAEEHASVIQAAGDP